MGHWVGSLEGGWVRWAWRGDRGGRCGAVALSPPSSGDVFGCWVWLWWYWCWLKQPPTGVTGVPVGQPGMLPHTGVLGDHHRSAWHPGIPPATPHPSPGIPGISCRMLRALWQLNRAESPHNWDSPELQTILRRCRGTAQSSAWFLLRSSQHLRCFQPWHNPRRISRQGHYVLGGDQQLLLQLDMQQQPLEPPGQQPPKCSDAGQAAVCSVSGGGIGKGPVMCSAVW